MASLMTYVTGGYGGWSRGSSKMGKVGRKLKAALKLGRGKARREKAAPGTLPLKARARQLAAMSPKNDSEAELQLLAQEWLKNKKAR